MAIHLFKPGNHEPMSGDAISFSENDLAASAAAYDPEKHEAPLVVGHPKIDDPAYGWVKSLSFSETGLMAEPTQVDAQFQELVNDGRFKKVSASFYLPDSKANPVPGVYYLRHVGFLGAQPPAVKGLRTAEFSEQEGCVTIEFSEQESNEQTSDDDAATANADPEQPPTDDKARQEDDHVTKDEAEKLAQENKALKAKIAQQEADARSEKNAAFAESLAAEAKLGAEQVPVIAATLDALQNPTETGVANFGEGDNATPLHTALCNALKAMPPSVEFGETATRERAAQDDDDGDDSVQYAENADPESIALDKKIRAYMKKHNVDYKTAAHSVAGK